MSTLRVATWRCSRKAAIYCAHHDLHRIVLGPLAGNPFPDATADFFAAWRAR